MANTDPDGRIRFLRESGVQPENCSSAATLALVAKSHRRRLRLFGDFDPWISAARGEAGQRRYGVDGPVRLGAIQLATGRQRFGSC